MSDLDRVALEGGILDAETDLMLLENLLETLDSQPDAFETFNVPRGDYRKKSSLIDGDDLRMLARIYLLLRDDVREISTAFYGKEDACAA